MRFNNSLTPNLFTHATSELSQDAFLAYLITWASPRYAVDKTGMHQAGKCFLQELLRQLSATEKTSKIDPSGQLKEVVVECQKANIDVLVNLHFANGYHLTLVIEDKIQAADYNDLNKYVNRAQEKENCSDDIRGIFIKTGEQFSYKKVESQAYGIFLREDFVRYFETLDADELTVKDTIFIQWRQQFFARQARLMGWQDKKVTDWTNDQFIGFYQHLTANWTNAEGKSMVEEWRWVNPPNGKGFYGLWSQMIVLPGKPWRAIFVQIQRDDLVIRTAIDSKNGKEITAHRNHIYHSLLHGKILGNDGALKMVKPNKFGHGKSMKICGQLYPNDWGYKDLEQAIKERYEILMGVKGLFT